MKVVSPQQMAMMEQQAYRDGVSENDFMEEAGSGVGLVVHEFAERYGIERQVIILCGKGNNAGDAFVAGVHLLHLDYHVHAYQLFPLSECSRLCKENAERFVKEGGLLTHVGFDEEIAYPVDGVILDGIFGTGFHGKVEDPIAMRIKEANSAGLPIISVDIPSGLDGETGLVGGPVIHAAETAFLGLPKIGFFLREGWNAVGKLRFVDFGLSGDYIEEAFSEIEMLDDLLMMPLLPDLKRSRSKYEAGYVLGVAGSPEMPGAALLSSISALRGGAGIVRLFHPEGMEMLLSSSPYEIIKTPLSGKDVKPVLDEMKRANSLYIGPGLGKSAQAKAWIKELLGASTVPVVIDADALNYLADIDLPLPANSILTPHLGELQRLLHLKKKPAIDAELLKICQSFAEEKQVTLILKGGPTFIFHPGKPVHVSPVGDPGMATAGTGDVLTGLIAALLAQGLAPFDAACLGVYLHGVSGEEAARDLTPYCMVASDLLDFFPMAFSFSSMNP
jgi:hydroxyethylthiazole kinase-like uncharacterized protein yjeF